jgi:hypothetical protein
MSKRVVLVITVLALLAALSACGDDDGGSVFEGSTTSGGESTTTAAETTSTTGAATTTTLAPTTTAGGGVAGHALGGLVAGSLAEGSGAAATVLTGNEEECFTSSLAQAIGEDRFAELDALAATADDMSEVFGQMTDPELDAMVSAISDCIDVEALLLAEMSGEDMSPEAAACVAGSVSQEDTLNSLVRAMITGEDPTTNPEFIAIMVPIMTEDCAEEMGAMLVDQLVAEGLSEPSATCVAEAFVQGGLLEAVINAIVTETDFTQDPELAGQLMTIFTQCLTPEEMGSLGG